MVCSSNPTQITDYPVSGRYLYQTSSQNMNTVGSAASIVRGINSYVHKQSNSLLYIHCNDGGARWHNG